MADLKPMPAVGVELSLHIGQRVRHRDYKGQRVTGVVLGLSVDSENALIASVALDAPIVIPPHGDGDREISIHWQTAPVHEFAPFDDRDELIAEMLKALTVTRGNVASLGPAGALAQVHEPYVEWLATLDLVIAKAMGASHG